MRWTRQYRDSETDYLPEMERLIAFLPETIPQQARSSIVHGDYRIDNVLFDGDGTLTAVLDWELATLGDPLADLGLLVAYWDGLGRLPASSVAALGPAAGLPEGPVLVAEYAARSGRDVSALPWYVAFGYFKIAVILEGIHYRFEQGQTIGPGFDRIGEVVPLLVTLGLSALP
jgi:aminoglycoside phosphotransferase (APT) family kinase protein